MSTNAVDSTSRKSAVRLWPLGNLLAFSHLDGATDYANGLVIRTVEGGLDVQIPGACSLRFSEAVQSCVITNDYFEINRGGKGFLRGVLLDAFHLVIEGECRITQTSPLITSAAHGDRLLVGTAACFNPKLIHVDLDAAFESRRRWRAGVKLPSSADSLAPAASAALERALSQMKGQVCSPEGLIRHAWTTPDRWPHRDMWLWDSAFHAIGWRHVDPLLAQSMIEAVLDLQREDGFIPHQGSPRKCSKITQPPILAFGAQLVLEKTNDLAWLERIYPQLCAYVEWDVANRDSDGQGLLEWFIDEAVDCRSGESGMDNSPRFDAAIPLDAPDFNAFLAGEYEVLSGLARRLGREEEAVRWAERHTRLCHLMNEKLWSEEHQLYCDRDPRSGTLSPVLSSAGFLPLLCGAPSEKQARALAAHLENPRTFGTLLPIPSIAACDTKNYSKDMWRGPVWININWMVARGLKRYGLHEAAQRLRTLTLAEIERSIQTYGTFFEYFDDRGEVEPPELLRKLKNIPGKHPHQAIHDYGWTATLYVDWLLDVEAR